MAFIVAALLILTGLIYKTRFGYEVRVIGENPEAARYAGIDFFRTTLVIMAISGGMAGLAGVVGPGLLPGFPIAALPPSL